MPTPNISINPVLTSNAVGSFSVDSTGYIQGTALNDPAVRNALAGGLLSSDETIPMWGGVGISELIGGGVSPRPSDTLGTVVSRAKSLTSQAAGQLTGFSVFDQAHNMVNSPQSPVPLAGTGMTLAFYRLRSNARIAVAMSPALINMQGQLITKNVSWDFTGQMLVPGQAAFPANVITAAVWAATNGGQVTFTTTTNHTVAVGSSFTIAGMTPDAYNGDYVAIAGTATNSLVAAKAVDPGASTVQGTLVAGGGFLPVTVLDVQSGNSMTVVYDPATGFATWNRQGSAAIIQI